MKEAAESSPSDLRSRKRLAIRQEISNAATRLFFARGFDQVTMDEIAAAADVGRMTVFNHFPRKEDLFFDREEEIQKEIKSAIQRCDSGAGPVEALRLFVHRLVSEKSRYVEFSVDSQKFVEAIAESGALTARARAIRDELAQTVAVALAESVGRQPADPDAQLGAAMLLGIWTVALIQGHAAFRQSQDPEKANAVFLALVDQGSVGLRAALSASPYI